MEWLADLAVGAVIGGAALFLLLLVSKFSIVSIGATEVGLVTKRFGKKLSEGNVIAFDGEAGYQESLLMPGLRFKFWPIFKIEKHPWVQVPPEGIGVVIAQVGQPLPEGAKSAAYKPEFGNFSDVTTFVREGGQQGIQRPVLPPGSLVPVHPVGFVVITANRTYGLPVSPDLADLARDEELTPASFNLDPRQLQVVGIRPEGDRDIVGIVTTLEGDPLPSGDIAGRIGGFDDIAQMETDGKTMNEVIDILLGTRNEVHNNYQDFQAFLNHGGKIGLQHDPLLYGAYLLNPFLVSVELAPMLVVEQGQAAVIKSYLGLSAADTSGEEFKFGSIVRPGHRGVWEEPLRTGKYPINPRIYKAEIVPTSILTLNWAEQTSEAHNLDAQLSSIDAKSREGFVFRIDLQVQIHVPDTRAPRVISMVGTMQNLVNEVLQSAVGNYFRNQVQDISAVTFIETRSEVQKQAEAYVREYLNRYEVETRGVYIQDVMFPEQLVEVLSQREIANQEKATYARQMEAQAARIDMERQRGTADAQAALAQAEVQVQVEENNAKAVTAKAEGEANYTRLTGEAEGAKIQSIGTAEAKATEALGLARAAGYEAQVQALGEGPTTAVTIAQAISDGNVDIMPDVLVTGEGGSFEGLAATLMRSIGNGNRSGKARKRAPEKTGQESAGQDLP